MQIYDPYLRKYRSKAEHILIWERVHGKKVPINCRIHHRDLDPGNNRAENLMCIPVPLHLELHAKLRRARKTMSTLAFEVARQRITEEYERKRKELMEIWALLADSTQGEH
ncbi:HNH endonuclease [Geomonas sp. RF6]|uniref:HNH endonuclease n=1 Tax=Geomonas sp. RF6 TaxID=2897342 RepID=UPI001E4FFB09|nr:HNH endonuclease [Geomonas sp. RF6]UFS72485.1 HNH endonuclease [Geomonas sp. RF6]